MLPSTFSLLSKQGSQEKWLSDERKLTTDESSDDLKYKNPDVADLSPTIESHSDSDLQQTVEKLLVSFLLLFFFFFKRQTFEYLDEELLECKKIFCFIREQTRKLKPRGNFGEMKTLV